MGKKKHIKKNSFINQQGKKVVIQGISFKKTKEGKRFVYQQTFKKSLWEKFRDFLKKRFKKIQKYFK